MITYQKLLRHVMDRGESRGDRTGTGTVSTFGLQWSHDMRDGFPLLTTKKMFVRGIFKELHWFLSGSTDVRDLQREGVHIWDEWATKEQCAKFGRPEGDLGPIYGYLWRSFPKVDEGAGGEVDQIQRLLDDICNNPQSRRLIVTGWHPDLATQVALPPCHTLWQCYCHEDGGLSLKLYARSIDIFLGLPFNIASYAFLLTMLGQVTGREPRHLIFTFGDLHLYNNHVDQAEEQLSRDPRPLPKLNLTRPRGSSDPMQRLLEYRWEHVSIEGYDPHPRIKAPVSV